MKITLLCENMIGYRGRKTCLAEWGLSVFVQTGSGVNLLFDTGHTDVYKKNARQLGIALNNTDYVVLSHYHWDHTGGLRFHDFSDKKKLITHPHVLKKLPPQEAKTVINDFDVVTSEKAFEFSPNIFYLGEIPRVTDFEQGRWQDDGMLDDSAIVIKTSKGAVVITGCSHAGICNICEHAKTVSGQPLYAVIGGFHLFANNQSVVDKTMNYFKSESPEHLFPMHCVDFPTQAKFRALFATEKYSTGDVITI
ncbi:MAG: hypothetical protein CSA45_04585 [Gammaproteobacteria bacterium]|nr:MAG: hypothetical protein CSA45_04585 [Gammaproteobacteria bacterium]